MLLLAACGSRGATQDPPSTPPATPTEAEKPEKLGVVFERLLVDWEAPAPLFGPDGSVTVGARPSLYAWGKMEDALSREHEVVDHAAHGAQGLYSLIGGKLASYRMFAQEAADLIAPKLGNHAPCTTHSSPLPGGDRPADIDLLAARFELSRFAVERLVTRHGSRAETILADSGRRGRMVVCSHEPVLACEVRWAAKHEYARTLLDVARRTNLAMGACGGNDCALAGAVIAGEELGWSPGEVRAQAAELLRSRQRSRLPAIGDKQARAEAMTMAALRTLGRAALP